MINEYDLIAEIINVEGGYVNDPDDSGGETNFGITKATAISYGYLDSMESMSINDAYSIYKRKYCNRICLNFFLSKDENVARKMLDISVNMGQHRAGKFIQQSLNLLNNRESYYYDLEVDGKIGTKTMSSMDAFLHRRGEEGCRVLVKMLNAMQGHLYIELATTRKKDEKFIYGWFRNRID